MGYRLCGAETVLPPKDAAVVKTEQIAQTTCGEITAFMHGDFMRDPLAPPDLTHRRGFFIRAAIATSQQPPFVPNTSLPESYDVPP